VTNNIDMIILDIYFFIIVDDVRYLNYE